MCNKGRWKGARGLTQGGTKSRGTGRKLEYLFHCVEMTAYLMILAAEKVPHVYVLLTQFFCSSLYMDKVYMDVSEPCFPSCGAGWNFDTYVSFPFHWPITFTDQFSSKQQTNEQTKIEILSKLVGINGVGSIKFGT